MREFIIKDGVATCTYCNEAFVIHDGVKLADEHICYKEAVIEKLSALVHDEWIEWSKDIASKEPLSQERLDRWKHYWIPYEELPEASKASDRLWALRALDIAEKYGYKRRE